MRDELLGYLLGALDAEEHQRVEEYLKRQPEGEGDLEVLRIGLAPLEADQGHVAPPPGLAQRACGLVAARRGMSDANELGVSAGGGLLLRDYLIAASIVLLASTILLPAIARSRWQSQVLECQHRLHMISTGLSSYSDAYAGMFPYVPNRGPLAVAGVFAPTLADPGYVADRSVFFCPAAEHTAPLQLPSIEQLRRASRDRREFARQLALLGDYAYTFGYVDAWDRYHGARNLNRSHFPVVADCPPPQVTLVSDFNSPNHGGSGINLLFEDGHVRWFAGPVASIFHDHPFLNRYRRVAPGIGPDDAVLAPRDKSPQF